MLCQLIILDQGLKLLLKDSKVLPYTLLAQENMNAPKSFKENKFT